MTYAERIERVAITLFANGGGGGPAEWEQLDGPEYADWKEHFRKLARAADAAVLEAISKDEEERLLQEARAHLAVALVQVASSDDEIIVGHLRAAHNLLVRMSVVDFPSSCVERLDLAQSETAAYRDTMKTVVAKREELIADLAAAADRLAECERKLAEADAVIRQFVNDYDEDEWLDPFLQMARTAALARHASRHPKEPEHD